MFNYGNNNGGSFNHGNGNIGSHNRGSNNIGSNIVLCDPRNPILALPTIEYLGSLYLASSTDPDAYCRRKGYTAAGYWESVIVTPDAPFSQFQIATLQPETLEICTPTEAYHCPALTVVECLAKGVARCVQDANGNLGNGNVGFHNIGHSNQGSYNRGSLNLGDYNRGNGNWGTNIVCNDLVAQDGAQCSIAALKTVATLVLYPYPPPSPPNVPSPSPPPPNVCDSRNPILALPTIEYLGTLYLVSATGLDTYCRRKGYTGAGYWEMLNVAPGAPFSQFQIASLHPETMEICSLNKSRFCPALTVVECLVEGGARCVPDENGNLGNGNVGYHNIGHNNRGNNNRGSQNKGDSNIGSGNTGSNIPFSSPYPCPTPLTSHTRACPGKSSAGHQSLSSRTQDAKPTTCHPIPGPCCEPTATLSHAINASPLSRAITAPPSQAITGPLSTAIAAVSLKVTPAPLSQAITAPLSKAIAAVSRKVTPPPLSQTITATFRQEAATTLPQAIATSSEQEATTPFSQAAISTAHQENPTPFP
ncbi:hypothetical protein ACKKBG_A26080 [Auxenochlorella protothecoides x Auxenochlorella symbiontica]